MDPLILRLGAMTVAGLHKYLPYRHWYRKELADYVSGSLVEAVRRPGALWNPALLRRMAADHIAGRKNWVREINMVLTLDAVERLLLRGRAQNDEPTLVHTTRVPACSF
jgi:asparagine synthase (glutamine-hydrolysing)